MQHGQLQRTLLIGIWCAFSTGCPEEDLQETQPRIEVCPRADAPAAECNRPLDLGDLPLTVTHHAVLFVRNSGDGDLVIETIKPANESRVHVDEAPSTVVPGEFAPLRFNVVPDVLGGSEDALLITSNDPETNPLNLRLQWNGTPKPVPHVELCQEVVAGPDCGVDLHVDFGVVRRSQRESRTVVVHNRGDATLQITGVTMTPGSSRDGELTLVTSTRAGFLPPGAEAPLTFLYEPLDGVADTLDLVFTTDDVERPVANIRVRGASDDNLPPTADARRAGSGETLVDVAVGDVVALDGSASMDPEGDPLQFQWTLYAPATSSTTLSDPAAGRVTFTPDRSGTYRVELLVTDSLGQPSSPTGLVLVQARPRYALRAAIEWTNGGDVDFHLVPQGDALFGATDCFFEQPRPELGDPAETVDNPSLLFDAESAPGEEEIVITAPRDGTYSLYAHYYAGTAPAVVTARVMFNDSGVQSLQVTETLPVACTVWHIGDVVFPAAVINPSAAPMTQLCR